MWTSRFILVAALALAGLLSWPAIEAVAQERGSLWSPGVTQGWNLKNLDPAQQQRMLRYWAFIDKKVPETYLSASNDIGYTTKAIADGGPLYLAQCKRCHGDSGLGNGELAMNLTPAPALLAHLVQQPIAIDQYLLWTISEGGKAFNTAMPAFKDTLTQDQIWSIIAYLRAGFPEVVGVDRPDTKAPVSPVQSDEPGAPAKP